MGRLRVAGGRDLEDRAGPGVAGAEGRKLGGRLLWKDDQVGLLVRRALTSGAALPFAATGSGSHLGGRGDQSGCAIWPHARSFVGAMTHASWSHRPERAA